MILVLDEILRESFKWLFVFSYIFMWMYSYAPKCSHLLSSKISKTTLRVYEYYEA